eukprot:1147177-Pelagomonas_calceolata.AAC.3
MLEAVIKCACRASLSKLALLRSSALQGLSWTVVAATCGCMQLCLQVCMQTIPHSPVGVAFLLVLHVSQHVSPPA